MQIHILSQFEGIVTSVEDFFAQFSRPIIGLILLIGAFLQGWQNIAGLLSVVGYFWSIWIILGYVFVSKAERLTAALGLLVLSSLILKSNIHFFVTSIFMLLGIYSIFFSKDDFVFLHRSESALYFQIMFFGLFLWGIQYGSKALVADSYHPFYEFGIGRCIEWGNWLSNCMPRDMAYLGGEVRYHFLATRLSYLFSYIGGIQKFSAVVFLVPMFFLWLTPILAEILSDELSWNTRNEKRLFLLIMIVGGCAIVPSFGLGAVLALLAILFVSRSNFLIAVPVMTALLLTKFTFFVVVFLAWGFFWLWSLVVEKRFLYKSLMGGFSTFILGFLLYSHFLKGAHPHCLWLPLPWVFINPFRPKFLSQAAPFDFFSFAWLLVLIVFGLCLFKFAYDRKKYCVALMSMCFSLGLLLQYFLLTEFVEGNNFQFTVLNNIFLGVMVFFFFKTRGITFLGFNLNACCENIIQRLCIFVAYLRIGWVFMLTALMPIKAAFLFFLIGTGNVIDMQSVQAWSFLEERKDFLGAVSGKHYEIKGRYSHDSNLPGDRGFFASGFSGKQLLAEGYCSRGIMMNSDYADRVAHILVFFKKFVLLSDKSIESFKLHFDSIEYLELPAYPMSQSPNKMIRFLHTLSLGREWHRVNYEKKLYQSMQKIIKELEPIDNIDYYISYFKKYSMGYLVLENADKPKQGLLEKVHLLYKNDLAIVLAFI